MESAMPPTVTVTREEWDEICQKINELYDMHLFIRRVIPFIKNWDFESHNDALELYLHFTVLYPTFSL
jgi:hypothetical protein